MKKFDKVGTPMSNEQVNRITKKMPKVKSKKILKETFGNSGGGSHKSIFEEVKKSFEEDKTSFLDEEKLLKEKS